MENESGSEIYSFPSQESEIEVVYLSPIKIIFTWAAWEWLKAYCLELDFLGRCPDYDI